MGASVATPAALQDLGHGCKDGQADEDGTFEQTSLCFQGGNLRQDEQYRGSRRRIHAVSRSR